MTIRESGVTIASLMKTMIVYLPKKNMKERVNPASIAKEDILENILREAESIRNLLAASVSPAPR